MIMDPCIISEEPFNKKNVVLQNIGIIKTNLSTIESVVSVYQSSATCVSLPTSQDYMDCFI